MQEKRNKTKTTPEKSAEGERRRPSLEAVRAEIERLKQRQERKKEVWGCLLYTSM